MFCRSGTSFRTSLTELFDHPSGRANNKCVFLNTGSNNRVRSDDGTITKLGTPEDPRSRPDPHRLANSHAGGPELCLVVTGRSLHLMISIANRALLRDKSASTDGEHFGGDDHGVTTNKNAITDLEVCARRDRDARPIGDLNIASDS